MLATLGALVLWSAAQGPPARPADPVVEDQPLDQPSFALIHTNDNRGYLESCG